MYVLYDRILERAKASYPVMCAEDYADPVIWDGWVRAWFAAAQTMRDEFVAEGLVQSIDALDKVVSEQKESLGIA